MTPFLLMLVAAGPADPSPTVTINPERVCADARSNRNLNFDLDIRNPGAQAVTITEIRASARNTAGELIEQRLLWQGATATLGAARTIPARGEALVFNPFTFDHPQRAAYIDFAVSFDNGSNATVKVTPKDCTTKARLRFPLKGRVIVYDGYDVLSHHRRDDWHIAPGFRAFGVTDNPWRFALDFIPIDAKGNLAHGNDSRLEDFYGWNAPVFAPGDGVVVAVHGSESDNALGSEKYAKDPITEDQMDPSGNYVLIDHGRGEMSAMSHLRSGSVTVKVGDRVRSGQQVARIGNSGATPIPHLHYELRSGFGIKGVRSLPPYFTGVTAIGATPTAGAFAPNTGDVLIAR
ncbi:MAG: M23 family metallopeptidase [Sphingomicrobium sp.]